MTSAEFKRWLGKIGCTFESGHGGHLIVRRDDRMSVLPMHGKQKELGTGFVNRIKDRRDLPRPSAKGRHRVMAPALIEAKVRLYEAMRTQKVTKTELARRLSVHMPQVDRLLDVHHGSQVSQLEAAFAAIGKRLVVNVEDAPRVKVPALKRKTA